MARRRVRTSETTATGKPRAKFDESKHKRGPGGRFGDKPDAPRAPAARRGGSVAQAHAIFDKMRGKPRADVLAAAAAAGINRNTASTQFYHWQRAQAKRELAAEGPNPSKEQRRAAVARALGVKPSTKPTAAPEAKPAPKPPPKPTSAPKPAGGQFQMKPGERPVQAFRRLADEMRGRPRADVIATAAAAGINRSTASVQYSAWLRSQSTTPVTAPPTPAPAPRLSARTQAALNRRPMTPEERRRDIDARLAREQAAAAERIAQQRQRDLAANAPVRRPVAQPAPEDRELIKDTTQNKPKPGSTASRMHDKLHRAASLFPGATFHAEYRDGKITGFSVMSDEVQITRRFNQNAVDHSFFVIEGERGNGVAKAFLAETVEAYRQNGYKSVKVHANIDVGGYAWLRYGFKPDRFSAQSLQEEIKESLTRSVFKNSLSNAERMEVGYFVRQGKLTELAAMTKPIKQADGTSVPLGKALFLGTDWHGELDLTDAAAMSTFRRYAGVEK